MSAAYLPHPGDLIDVAITWGIGLVLTCAGTALVGRRSGPEYRMLAGWGALCVALTAWGVLLPVSLRFPAVLFVAVAVASQLKPGARLQADDWRALGRTALVTLPLWIIMAPIRPSQPDTFLNLLPNAMYLVDYARLPTAASPPSFSYLPAAPYNVQLLTFVGSLLNHGYPPAGLSLVNVMLQLAAGLAIGRALGSADLVDGRAPSWRLTALGFLLATLLNPGFVPRFNFSAYGETALTVTAMFAACFFIQSQGELAAGRRASQAASLALVLAAMVNAKQSGIGLVAALAGAAALAGYADRLVSRQALLRFIVASTFPACLLFGLWRYYVAYADVAELTPLPPAEWNWSIAPELLASAGRIIGEKAVYFTFVAIALVGLPLLKRRWGWTATTRLLAFHAAAFVLYNLYLVAAYIAHFSPGMSAEAHSYFRYNTHLALVLVLALALAVRDLTADTELMRRYRELAGAALVGLALLVPIAFIGRLRFDLVMPQPLVWELANQIKPYVQRGGRLALLLPGDNGSVDVMLSGLLMDAQPRRRDLDLLYRPSADGAALAEAERLKFPLALISCTPEGGAALLKHDHDGWHRLAAWRYPAEAHSQRWQQILAWEPLCHGP
ncbi:MAG TPA: hypothetical protein VGP42_01380 [Stellaceae bacterium]|jgi:hypothetical protein|nr:hypothetical protein [Stellaceae bacterium]